jgi:phosphopantothenoylcysteine decarboxylase/phosphopantothenate--cysteine ligase
MARVLLCVGGGIAAYKAPMLVRDLIRAGHEVQVLMTEAAASFVTELSLSTVSKRPVRRTLLDASAEGEVGHIELADWPDLVVVAPGTANLMARAAAGLANDLVTTVLLATRAPVLWAPAMNTNMWTHPATLANRELLRSRGAGFVGPDEGDLACGWVGTGRMVDPELIVEAVRKHLAGGDAVSPSDWQGKRVLVSAGPTRAYLDPVRFISNASTGSMGVEIAAEAAKRGAEVTLIAGPLQVAVPSGLRRVDVETATEMYEAMQEALGAPGGVDFVAMVAAVADYAPSTFAGHKLGKKDALAQMEALEWTKERDILASLCSEFGDRSYFLGFAAQTASDNAPESVEAQLLAYGREKLAAKGAQAIFVNRVGVPGTGFGSPTNAGWLLEAASDIARESGGPRPKDELAGWMLDQLISMLSGE